MKRRDASAAWGKGGARAQLTPDAPAHLVCPNCGGDVPVDAERCPYCGALNPQGAEAAYMDELEELKQDTDRLDDDVRRGIVSDLGRNAKSIALVIMAIVAAIAIAVTAANCVSKSDEQRELADFQAREAFREQHFDELQRLYEAHDDAALVEYAYSLEDESGFEALYSWKHMPYVEAVTDWQALNDAQSAIDEGYREIGNYTWATTAALRLACMDFDDGPNGSALTPEDEQRVSGYRMAARQYLRETLQMDDDEIDAFASAAENEYGYVQLNKLEEALKGRFDQLGIDYEEDRT